MGMSNFKGLVSTTYIPPKAVLLSEDQTLCDSRHCPRPPGMAQGLLALWFSSLGAGGEMWGYRWDKGSVITAA